MAILAWAVDKVSSFKDARNLSRCDPGSSLKALPPSLLWETGVIVQSSGRLCIKLIEVSDEHECKVEYTHQPPYYGSPRDVSSAVSVYVLCLDGEVGTRR